MTKASIDGSEITKLLLQDAEFKNEYDRLKPRYDLIAKVINKRTKKFLKYGNRLNNTTKQVPGSPEGCALWQGQGAAPLVRFGAKPQQKEIS